MISDGSRWVPENQQKQETQAPQSPQQRKATSNPFQIGDIDYGEY